MNKKIRFSLACFNLAKAATFFSLLATSIFGISLSASPPMTIPEEFYKEFTLDDNIPVTYIYSDESRSSNEALVFQYAAVEQSIQRAKAKETGHYKETDIYLYQALDKYSAAIENKNVAVMGSQTYWYESILLSYGARLATTIEYNKIISQHPKIEALTVSEFDANPRTFDAILSISSFEHDGLGRYGDPINPNGDLNAMEKTKKALKKDGLLFLVVPVGKDRIVWNLHRIYGNKTLPRLFSGWQVVDTFGFSSEQLENETLIMGQQQPVFVLKPIS